MRVRERGVACRSGCAVECSSGCAVECRPAALAGVVGYGADCASPACEGNAHRADGVAIVSFTCSRRCLSNYGAETSEELK